jgi:hypothetical protein
MAISFKPKIQLFGSGGALDDGTLAKNALNAGAVNLPSGASFSGTPSLTVPGSVNDGSGGIYTPQLSTAQKMTSAVVNNPGSTTGTAVTSSAAATDPAGRVKADLDAGMGFAKEHIAEGSLGRLNDARANEVNDLLALQKGQIGSPGISDPRKAQMDQLLSMQQQQIAGMTDPRSKEADDLLAMQKQRLQGMTPEEQRAAFEQGQVGINRQMSSSLRHLGGLAAANGVRGGAAAGLQMGAVNAATAAQGDLQRKLVLDNLAQKNLAYDQYGNQLNNQQRITLDSRGQKMQATDQYGRTLGNQQATELGIQQYNKDQQGRAIDRYGNTLTQQQGVGLGIDQYNIGQQNKEKLGQLGAAFQYGGLIDSYRAGDDAKALGDKNIALSEKALDLLMKGNTNAEDAAKKATTDTQVSADRAISTATTNLSDQTSWAGMNLANKSAGEIKDAIKEKMEADPKYEGMSETEFAQEVEKEQRAALKKSLLDAGYSEAQAEARLNGDVSPMTPQGNKIICTEAFRQNLITEEQWQVTQRYRKLLTLREYRGYLHWARPVVARMRRSPAFARGIAPIVRRMIQAERFALGEIPSLTLAERAVAAAVKIANYTGAALRSLTLKLRKGAVHG